MSRETPATHLARLKVTYQSRTLRAVEPGKGTGYTAQLGDASGGLASIYAATVGELESRLADEDTRRAQS